MNSESNMYTNITATEAPVTSIFTKNESMVFAVFLSIVLSSAIFGNAIVVWASLMRKRTSTVIDLFIASLALADILLSVSRLCVVAALLGQGWEDGSVSCQIFAFLQTSALSICLHSVALIAIHRYVLICRNNTYKIFTKSNSKLYVGAVWLLGCSFALPPWFGFSEFRYFPATANCYFSQSSSPTYHALQVVFTFVLSTAIIIICYWRIFKRLRTHRQSAKTDEDLIDERPKASQIQFTYTIFLIGLSFVLSYFPPALAGILAIAKPDISHTARFIGVTIHYFAITTHPIVYGFMNPRLRRIFLSATGLNAPLFKSRKIFPRESIS